MSKLYILQLILVAIAVCTSIPLGIEVAGAMSPDKITPLAIILGISLFGSYTCGIVRLIKTKNNDRDF